MNDGGSQLVCILVVEDDLDIRRMVVNYFDGHNMRCLSASGRHDMVRHFGQREPSLVILDLKLGRENGFDLLREIRSRSNVPVIITTGHHRDETDQVLGLELGADDYVIKPFSLRELLARVRAVLRRRDSARLEPQRNAPPARWRFGGWQLDGRTRHLTDPLSRVTLLQATRMNEDIFDRSIDVQVLRLRRKLEIDSRAPRVIQTERGVGYLFILPVERF